MDKEFSHEFMTDLADLIDICMQHNTDNITLEFEINNRLLEVNFGFEVKEQK